MLYLRRRDLFFGPPDDQAAKSGVEGVAVVIK
jgi:hypothetical protein